jgi:F-type H+-transporting ATPase subunit a
MINNLFSIFDPSTSISISLNWLSSIYVILFIPRIYWLIPSRWNFFLIYLLQLLIEEFKLLLNIKKNLLNILIFIRLFIIIFFNNFIGIFSYIFTSSSHLRFRLTLSLSIWLSFILFGWIKNTNHIFIHLVPQGTPIILINFIVIIETISNFIRFGSLAVRLSANIIAGHLLVRLLSSLRLKGFPINIFVILSQCILLLLELSVTFIQAYVFTVLSILYRIELS